MLVRDLSVQNGLPTELFGLLTSNFFSPTLVGAPAGPFYDACKVVGNAANTDGLYVMCGTGPLAGSAAPHIMILTGSAPLDFFNVSGYAGDRFTGCTAMQKGIGSSIWSAWFIGPGDANVARVDSLANAAVAGDYYLNGAVMSGAVPKTQQIAGIESSSAGLHVVAYGERSDTSSVFMSRKSVTDTTTSAWTPLSVPASSATMYVKARQSNAGFVVAIDDLNHVNLSTTSGATAMILDSSITAIDLDHSWALDTFIACDGANVYTAIPAWSSAGPAGWVLQTLPGGVGFPTAVVAIDVPSYPANKSDFVNGQQTWFMIVCLNSGANSAITVLTQDFNTYYSMPVTGVQLTTLGFSAPRLRFVNDRLFSFTSLGASMSGRVGTLMRKQ